jgi:antitoxin component YwqK of YwqJK toxin-antitoxin module
MSHIKRSYANEYFFSYINGNVTYIFKHGILAVRQEKKGNTLTVAMYYPNGQIKHIGTHTDTNPRIDLGEMRTYDECGNLTGTMNYETNKQITYHSNGKIESEAQIVDGKFQGTKTTYYESGNIKRIDKFVDDKRVDEIKVFYESGAIYQIAAIVRENIEGKIETYDDTTIFYENGKIKQKGVTNFITGKNDGMTSIYNDLGIMTHQQEYKDGVPNGIRKVYYPNGNVQWDGTFVNNKWVGQLKKYRTDGKLHCIKKLREDSITADIEYYHRSGKLLSNCISINDKCNGEAKQYYSTGELYACKMVKDDADNGPQTIYYRSGVVKKFWEAKDGKIHGKYKTYYKSGRTKLIQHYKDGILHGIVKKYRRNEKLRVKEMFENGKRHGKRTTYYNNTNVCEEKNYQQDVLISTESYEKD